MILASGIGNFNNRYLLHHQSLAFAQTQGGSRPGYIYDYAGVLSDEYSSTIDRYVRAVDDSTTAEIVIYTIPSFVGHGIKKDGIEIQDRDMLANYIYNELPLDGVKGIGKKGKDNGVLILLSLQPDAGGGSMRIEVGRGLEGNITDGTAGAILDAYLVPAMNNYRSNSGDKSGFDRALLNTVMAIGSKAGYTSSLTEPGLGQRQSPRATTGRDNTGDYSWLYMLVFLAFGILPVFFRRRRRGFYYGGGGYGGGGWGGGGGGGFGGGGGGGSGGGGAGR